MWLKFLLVWLTSWDEWRGDLDGRVVMRIKRLCAWRAIKLDLHQFVGADREDCFHTHPSWAVRFVLWGGYVEQLEDGTRKTWRPGMIGLVRPALSHRIYALRNQRVSYSLWLRGPKLREIELRGQGWERS
jgi:hypothetical protein